MPYFNLRTCLDTSYVVMMSLSGHAICLPACSQIDRLDRMHITSMLAPSRSFTLPGINACHSAQVCINRQNLVVAIGTLLELHNLIKEPYFEVCSKKVFPGLPSSERVLVR